MSVTRNGSRFLWSVTCVSLGWLVSLPCEQVLAQGPRPPAANNPKVPPRKLTEAEKAAQAVLNAYTDAANFQNSGAFPLAIEAWKKLLKSYPNDPLASKARHYLGICYLRIEQPDYERAIQYLREALKDDRLDVREETLVKLGNALYDSGLQLQGDAQKQKFAEASKVFAAFLNEFADGSFADQAIFCAGECEYQLGKLDRAAILYRRLVDQASFSKSELRPDAIFSLGVLYQDQQQSKLAMETFERLLKEYPKHRLARDTQMRLAELYLVSDRLDEAVKFYAKLSESKEGDLQDYILYRYGYALAKQGKYAESSDVYQQLGKRFPNSQYAANSALAAGQTLMRDKKYAEAAKYFQQILPLRNEPAVEAAHLLAQIYMLQNKAEDAAKVARDALTWVGSSPRLPAIKMDLAEALATTAQGQSEARALFEQIAAKHSEDPVAPRAAYNAAFAALQNGALVDAQRWGEAFAKLYPQDPLAPDVAYIVAESTLQQGKYADAAAAFEKLLQSQTDNPASESWQLRLGHAYYMGNMPDQLHAHLMKLIDASQSKDAKAEAYFLIGASLMKQAKYSEAEDTLKRSLEVSPNWAQADEAHLILAQAQLRSGKNEEAKTTLDELRKKFPKSRFADQAEYRIGQISAASGDFKTALASYQRVLDSEKDAALKDLASYGKAWVLMQQDQYEQAMELLKPLTVEGRQDSVASEAFLAKAICLRNLNKPAEAVSLLEGMLNKPSQYAVPLSKILYELGLSYVETKNFDKASTSFDRLIQEFPDLSDMDKVLYEYAWALKEQQRTQEASATFSKLSQKFPKSPFAAEAEYHLGQQAYEEGAFDRAMAAYSKAILQTEDPALQEKSLYKLGWTYFQQADYVQAATQFAKQLEAVSDSLLAIEGRFMQGESMMKAEKFDAAMQHYEAARKALQSHPDAEELSPQVQNLIYLHGAQSARELKRWNVVDEWLGTMTKKFPESEYLPLALYEKAYSAQSQNQAQDALKLYEQVAENNRNEIGARARFMMGELYFGEKDFGKAVPEFEKVIYGFGAKQAPEDVKNWQARAALEAGRCSEVLVNNLTGPQRSKAIQIAKKFYQIVLDDHPKHELVGQAKNRIDVLNKLPVN